MTLIRKSNAKLGREIQYARKKIGFTQEELAEKLNISRTHIGHIEQGRKSPSFELLEKLSRILKIKIKDIFPF